MARLALAYLVCVALVLASGEADYTPSLVSFAWIMAAALLAPLVSYVLRGN